MILAAPASGRVYQVLAGLQHCAASYRLRIMKPAATVPSATVAPSRRAGREQGACQPTGVSVTLLPPGLSWSSGLREPLCPLDCGPGTERGLLSPPASPARPKLASPVCVPGRRATIVSQESIIVLREPYLIRERKMGL